MQTRLTRMALLIAFIFIANHVFSQCSFTPTITISPPDPDNIYCPGDIVTLETESYDSY